MTPPATSRLLATFKQGLTRIGQSCSPSLLFQFQSTVNYLKVGRWMADHGFDFKARVANRHEVWNAVVREVGNQPVLYLEFGVDSGEATRYWAANLKHPKTLLHGVDSFEGMPTSGGPWAKGQFSTGGQIPEINDPRVKFFKGWFDQVLPDYIVPPHSTLILNLDADLYSSTAYVLQHLQPHIKKGTFIYFDEMNFHEHEPKAFHEFIAATGVKFTPVAADKTLTYVCFKCLG